MYHVLLQEGGFYSAEDADSYPASEDKQKQEGAFCVWTYDEVVSLLSRQIEPGTTLSELFCAYYGIKENGNVDPQQVVCSRLTSAIISSICIRVGVVTNIYAKCVCAVDSLHYTNHFGNLLGSTW